LQSDFILLGLSIIATAISGFGAAMLGQTERILTAMGVTAAPPAPKPPRKYASLGH
jgi:hypothetical protein